MSSSAFIHVSSLEAPSSISAVLINRLSISAGFSFEGSCATTRTALTRELVIDFDFTSQTHAGLANEMAMVHRLNSMERL
jgi:hypothetical protein